VAIILEGGDFQGGGTGVGTGGGKSDAEKKKLCDSVAGTGGIVTYGNDRFMFNSGGFLTGFGVTLSGNFPVAFGDNNAGTIPPNTRFGAQLQGSDSVVIGFNQPISTPGLSGAYFQSATFSDNSFKQAVGALRFGGISIGSPTTPSSYLLGYLNESKAALNIGSSLLTILQTTSKNLNCDTLLALLP
jgi:hypothetical protein